MRTRQLILEPTPVAQWQALVHEAQRACGQRLDERLESYLVFLLLRFTDRPECTARIMARDYLRSQASNGEQQFERLRDVGDHCLLFSGLFPHLAERRLVSIGYFTQLGQSSYRQLHDLLDRGRSAIYGHLSEAFIVLMDILQAMRELGGEPLLTPLQAHALWQATGSRRCYRQLCAAGQVAPAPVSAAQH